MARDSSTVLGMTGGRVACKFCDALSGESPGEAGPRECVDESDRGSHPWSRINCGRRVLVRHADARIDTKDEAHWVETCFCDPPLEEERPYWEKYFDLLSVKDAHSRRNCRHENGTEPWACCDCDCTKRLEERLAETAKFSRKGIREQCLDEATEASTGRMGSPILQKRKCREDFTSRRCSSLSLFFSLVCRVVAAVRHRIDNRLGLFALRHDYFHTAHRTVTQRFALEV
jgi:hypothetical protein